MRRRKAGVEFAVSWEVIQRRVRILATGNSGHVTFIINDSERCMTHGDWLWWACSDTHQSSTSPKDSSRHTCRARGMEYENGIQFSNFERLIEWVRSTRRIEHVIL